MKKIAIIGLGYVGLPLSMHFARSGAMVTGIALNTSVNENEPVVYRPEEALDCFLRTKMDMLVLDGFLVACK